MSHSHSLEDFKTAVSGLEEHFANKDISFENIENIDFDTLSKDETFAIILLAKVWFVNLTSKYSEETAGEDPRELYGEDTFSVALIESAEKLLPDFHPVRNSQG